MTVQTLATRRETVGQHPSRVHLPRWVAVLASIVILAATVWFVVIPQFAEASGAVASLEKVALPLLAVAFALEVLSLASYSMLTKAIVDVPGPTFFTFFRVDLTDLGVNHVVPGGGVTSGALRLRLFTDIGIPPSTGFTAATIQITGSNLVLGGIFGLGVALSLSAHAGTTAYAIAASAVLALLVSAGAGVWVLLRHTDASVRWVRAIARFIPFVTPVAAEAFVRAMSAQVRELGKDRRRMVISVILAALNWLLDAAALWVMFAAFGHPLGIGTVLTVYGLGSILAMLPLTPGGLGIVEGLMIPAFVAFGTPASVALLGVLGWRLLEYWMPIPLSLIAYSSLKLSVMRNVSS